MYHDILHQTKDSQNRSIESVDRYLTQLTQIHTRYSRLNFIDLIYALFGRLLYLFSNESLNVILISKNFNYVNQQ